MTTVDMSERWWHTETTLRRGVIMSGVLCALLFLATLPLPRADGHLVGSDGLSYYAIVRSLVLDGDLDFSNDYALLGVEADTSTPTGKPANPFAIGTALLWMPFFVMAHVLSLVLNLLGIDVATNGISYIYEAAVCVGTIIYATVGFVFAYRVARNLASATSALIATLGLWWASQALYYLVAEPSMSHGISIFAMGLFLALWFPPRQRSSREWVWLGVAAALATLVRWQDGVVLALPFAELAWSVRHKRVSLQAAFKAAGIMSGVWLLGMIPQLLMWNSIYGTPLTIPQGSDFIQWFAPNPIETLFSTRHGLLLWHPVLLLALVGFIPLWRKHRALALAGIFLVLIQLYINSAVGRWWADDAFGGRRFTGLLPWLVPALAVLLSELKATRWRRWAVGLLLVLVLWNGLSFAQYRLGFVSRNEALSWREMTIDRLLLPIRIVQ